MPLDSQGQFRHNHESAKMHTEAAGKKYADPEEKESGEHSELHPHGDGSFHTVHQGEKAEHPSLGHALIHLAGKHADEGHSHFHAHHDGMEHHSHSVHGGGEPESRDHENEQGVEDHLQEHLGGGSDEGEEMAQTDMQGHALDAAY